MIFKKTLITIMKILIFFMGWVALSTISVIYIKNDNPAVYRFLLEFIPFIVMTIFTLLFLMIEKGNVKLQILKNMFKGAITGIVVGIVWIGISITILLVLKEVVITNKNEVPFLGLWIISAFINVVMQELLVKGYIYQLLKTKYNLSIAILITTLLFTLLHGASFEAGIIPVVNVVTMCLFTTFLYESTETIISPIMAHAVWNIVGAIVFGGVSLANDYPNIFTIASHKNSIVFGKNYNIEASIIVTIINVALTFLFWYIYRKKKSI